MRVMMSAAGSVVAPGIIQHLQSWGHFVIGHDMQRYSYGASICDEFHTSPPVARAKDYLDFLSFRDCDAYLPFLDEELRLPGFNIVAGVNFASPATTLHMFTSKIRQQDALELAGLPVAPHWKWGSDYVAKPDHGRGGKRNFRAAYGDIADALDDRGWLVQQFIEGDEYTVDVLTDLNGGFLFAVPRLRIQANGVSTIGRISMDGDVIKLARDVCANFEFRGPINIQVIREKDTGSLFIIEVNARLSGSCMFTVIAGFDIVEATLRLYQGLPFIEPEEVKELTVRRHYVETIA